MSFMFITPTTCNDKLVGDGNIFLPKPQSKLTTKKRITQTFDLPIAAKFACPFKPPVFKTHPVNVGSQCLTVCVTSCIICDDVVIYYGIVYTGWITVGWTLRAGIYRGWG